MNLENQKGEKLEILHKEIDLIQAVITRMAQNSFYMKGWCITLVAAIFSLSDGTVREHVYLPLALMVVVFWILDSYYLRQERAYRNLYGHVLKCRIKRNRWQNLYSLDVRKMLRSVPCVPRIMFSISEWPLYLILFGLFLCLGRGDVRRVGDFVGRSVFKYGSNTREAVLNDPVKNAGNGGCQQMVNFPLRCQNETEKEQVRFESRAMLHEHPVLKATNNHTSKDKK